MTLEAYRRLAPELVEAGGAVVTRFPQAPDSPMLNRAVGLGVDTPALETDVDAVLRALQGTTFYVAVAPDARPDLLPRWLAARGLEPGWGWMTFRRRSADPPAVRSVLVAVEVQSEEQASEFARIIRIAFELPEATDPVFAGMPDRGWLCWLAYLGDEPAAAAAMYVTGGAGYLSFAATLPDHRGEGAQSLLLSIRIQRAVQRGCDIVVSETGELRDGLPSNSYRNLLRAGFEEVAVTANWLGRS